jgi:hypothetical protein
VRDAKLHKRLVSRLSPGAISSTPVSEKRRCLLRSSPVHACSASAAAWICIQVPGIYRRALSSLTSALLLNWPFAQTHKLLCIKICLPDARQLLTKALHPPYLLAQHISLNLCRRYLQSWCSLLEAFTSMRAASLRSQVPHSQVIAQHDARHAAARQQQ